MKTTVNIFLAAALIGFSACSDSDSKSTASTNQTSTAPANTNPTATSATAGDVALNPEHGQPGHRCDLEVGAPLNLPAQPKLATPPPVFQPQTSGAVAAGTNPAHGQPGHDCAVPVGAPLPK